MNHLFDSLINELIFNGTLTESEMETVLKAFTTENRDPKIKNVFEIYIYEKYKFQKFTIKF